MHGAKARTNGALSERASPGMRQLLWGDVHSERAHFAALYTWLASEVVFAADRTRLDTLPQQSRAKLLAVVAAFTPYYTPPQVAYYKHPVCFLYGPYQ